MLTQDNLKNLLLHLQFTEEKNQVFIKNFSQNAFLKVDFNTKELIYPEIFGMIINERQTCNFSQNENFVVFECVHRLLEKGYKPEHIELEPKWKLGRGASGGRADILVKNQENNPLLLIECKTAGKEFTKAWKDTQQDGGQLFSYAQQIQETQFLCLYATDFDVKNQIIITEQRIISHKDNKDVLAEDIKLKSFAKAQNLKERIEVWKNTYKTESTESGIFEENIRAYQIGKDKYTLDFDTKPLSSIDKKGLYHEFRTILRTYNVSRRENAFDVLVNLFMCKIIDEKENKNDLKFFWKGIAYDNYYDLVDRLQGLYQEGMRRFLEEDILYVSNEQIDNAFWTTKSNRNATKTRIKEIFRELKFFKGLDFEFVKVHNKKGFDKNAKILIKIIQMWQHIRITTQNQNQFLGDMFEYFLDNGIKQTEGQFFTPIPICKFIIAALPLEQKIKDKSEPLKAIDYACGAGHFLNEYALAIKPLVEKHKQNSVSDYHKQIFGIEKEDRLAKVAKVSAYMYGQDAIEIIDDDALVSNPKIKEQTFDVLIANPPFAVTDFLTTLNELDEKESTKFELFSEESRNSNNIQCFFLERAKHLLAPDAVTGVIVPTSVLSNADTMHTQTREILLKYFDFVSLVELGSGTFGKTGTNTVVLFLKRKSQNPEQAEHFWNRTQDYFENPADEIEANGGVYQDLHVLKKYCEHIEISVEDYQAFLMLTVQNFETFEKLGKYEIFKDYKQDFDKSTEIVNLQKTPVFKKKSPTEQQTELNQRLIKYLHKIEMQKFYYFMLAYHNPQKVLIVKSPQDNKEQKQFLGYEWSASKGNEGIQYNGGDTVYDIQTPLFNPNNRDDQSKISFLIQQNFQGNSQLSESSEPFCTYTSLVDMLDFSRKDFNKAISLNNKKKTNIESKWDLVKLENLCEIVRGVTYPKNEEMNEATDNIVLTSDNVTVEGYFELNKQVFISEKVKFDENKRLRKNDIFMCFASGSKTHIGKVAFIDKDTTYFAGGFMGILRVFENKIYSKFLFEMLNLEIFRNVIRGESSGSNINNLSSTINQVKIPLPPLEVQKQIVAECEAIDIQVSKAKQQTIENKQTIEEKIEIAFGQYDTKKLSEFCFVNPSKTEIRNIDENTLVSFVEMASVSNEGFIATKVARPLKDLKKGSYTYFAENDVIIAKITPCMENGKCALATGLSNNLGMGSSEFHVFRAKNKAGILSKYIFILLNREIVRKEAEKNMTGASGHRRVPASFYEDFKIPVPPLSVQEDLVKEIEILELQITENQQIISTASQQKQAVMKKYL